MMTGLYQPTTGNVEIFGLDGSRRMDEARKSMGVCPQHDILFDKLTVYENLELFAAFKGVSKEKMHIEIT